MVNMNDVAVLQIRVLKAAVNDVISRFYTVGLPQLSRPRFERCTT
jgi:hypothetical protein